MRWKPSFIRAAAAYVVLAFARTARWDDFALIRAPLAPPITRPMADMANEA